MSPMRTMVLGGIAAVLTLLAAGCGDSGDETTTVPTETASPGDDTTTSSSTTTTTLPVREPAQITQTGEVAAADEAPIDLGPIWAVEDPPLPSELCSPEDPAVTFLGDLGDPVPVDRAQEFGSAVQIRYENRLGQAFDITAVATDEELAASALTEMGVCLQAVPLGADPGETAFIPELPSMLASLTVLKLNEELLAQGFAPVGLLDLIVLREQSNEGHSPTLGQLVAAYTDSDVLATLTSDLQPSYPAGMNLSVGDQIVGALWDQPDAPFLDFGMIEEIEMDDGLLEFELDTVGAVLFEIDVANPALEDYPNAKPDEPVPLGLVGHIDPTVHRKPTWPYKIYYRAKCASSAWADLTASEGRMSMYFWRKDPYYLDIGSRYANAEGGDPTPPSISHGSGVIRSYDISVRGWENNSQFSVDGSWTLGWGGGC